MPLLHTWSLAVEEQYYVVIPLLLMVVYRFGINYLLGAILVLFAISFGLSAYYVERQPSATFYLLPFRFWELLVGSILATVLYKRPSVTKLLPAKGLLRELLAFTGLGLIAYALLSLDANTPFPGPAALAPCLGSALLIFAHTGGSSQIGRLLSTKPFVTIGLQSYPLYLWHWPILVFMKQFLVRPLTVGESIAAVLLSLSMGYLSWRFVERPFRGSMKSAAVTKSRGTLFPSPQWRALGITVGCMGFFGCHRSEFREAGRLAAENARSSRAHCRTFVGVPSRKECAAIPAEEVSIDRLCRIGNNDLGPTFMVWGDSHAMSLMLGFDRVAKLERKTGIDASFHGCQPLIGAVEEIRLIRVSGFLRKRQLRFIRQKTVYRLCCHFVPDVIPMAVSTSEQRNFLAYTCITKCWKKV